MKTVAIIAYAEAFSGGINQYALSLLDALRLKASYRFVIITRPENHHYDNLGFDVWRFSPPGLLRRLGNYFLLALQLRKPWFLRKGERELLETVDLFLSPTISPYPFYFLERPYLFTFHDMQERYFPQFFTMVERMRRFLYARALVEKAANIIVESRCVRKDLHAFLGVDEGRIVLLPAPPPIDLLMWAGGDDELMTVKRKYGLPEEFLFYPAQFWPHKNHLNMLRAFSLLREKHKNLYLVLTGYDHGGAASLVRMIRELRLEKAVVSLGYIDYLDLAAIYKLARILVMPSLFESISLPIYEAFALGVPVVCSNLLALPEQVGDAALLFDPLDVEDMFLKIDCLLESSVLAEELVVRGKERIDGFSHEMYASRLVELIDNSMYFNSDHRRRS